MKKNNARTTQRKQLSAEAKKARNKRRKARRDQLVEKKVLALKIAFTKKLAELQQPQVKEVANDSSQV